MRSCEGVRKIWLLCGVTGVILFYVLFAIYYDPNPNSWRSVAFNFAFNKNQSYGSSNISNEGTKQILYWNTMFGDETFYFGKGDIFEKCHGVAKNCFATHERFLTNVENFDAILFHGNELSLSDLPPKRRAGQNFVFVNLESPKNRPGPHSQIDKNFFNLTMTYRLDSDVIWSYADIRSLEDERHVAPKLDTVWRLKPYGNSGTNKSYEESKATTVTRNDSLIKRRNKSKTAIWFVSNCLTPGKREKYANELANHVDVDIYGKCGKTKECPRDRDCFQQVVEPDYYFYLSFENSMCQDYVTEKLYKALRYDVVPIVYGGANYSLFVPPGSYINALDFDSPRDLAMYLKRLIAHPREYDKYFEWKMHYRIANSIDRVICQLCQYLHDNRTAKFYSSLTAWYKTDKCPLQEKLKKLPYVTKRDL